MSKIIEGNRVIQVTEREMMVPYGTMTINEPVREVGLVPARTTSRGLRRVINAQINAGANPEEIKLAEVRSQLQELGRKKLLNPEG